MVTKFCMAAPSICGSSVLNALNLLKTTAYVMHEQFNPLNTKLNPICHLLALVGAHKIFHVSKVRVNIQQLYALPTLYLCVLYLSENKKQLVPLTA